MENINGMIFLKVDHIVGNPKKGITGLLPFSKATWYKGVRDGIFPKPVKLSLRCAAWRADDINKVLAKLNVEPGSTQDKLNRYEVKKLVTKANEDRRFKK